MTPAQLHLLTQGEAALMSERPASSSSTGGHLADADELEAFARANKIRR